MDTTDDDVQEQWRTRGWVSFEQLLPEPVAQALPGWVDAISRAPEQAHERRLHFHEQTDGGPALCRTERYLDDHADARALVTSGPLAAMAARLLGEPAVVYKEKINYKLPGGAGFAPHQDATAYRFIDRHVTCLVAVDPMTRDNGCLEFARGHFAALLPDDGDGCLSADVAAALDWQPVPLPRGGVIFFSSLVPHRSGPNRTCEPRRALYVTMNARSAGDRRADYYATLERSLARASGPSARISTIGHFQGRAAPPPGR